MDHQRIFGAVRISISGTSPVKHDLADPPIAYIAFVRQLRVPGQFSLLDAVCSIFVSDNTTGG
jgi:hypothetical protein